MAGLGRHFQVLGGAIMIHDASQAPAILISRIDVAVDLVVLRHRLETAQGQAIIAVRFGGDMRIVVLTILDIGEHQIAVGIALAAVVIIVAGRLQPIVLGAVRAMRGAVGALVQHLGDGDTGLGVAVHRPAPGAAIFGQGPRLHEHVVRHQIVDHPGDDPDQDQGQHRQPEKGIDAVNERGKGVDHGVRP